MSIAEVADERHVSLPKPLKRPYAVAHAKLFQVAFLVFALFNSGSLLVRPRSLQTVHEKGAEAARRRGLLSRYEYSSCGAVLAEVEVSLESVRVTDPDGIYRTA